LPQHGIDKGCLAMVNMGNNGDISKLFFFQ